VGVAWNEKLVKRHEHWQDFLALVKCMEKAGDKEYKAGRWDEYDQSLPKSDEPIQRPIA
jgi:hypothetical protein